MTFFEEWANLHKTKETDEEYFEYHKKKKGEKGYISKNNFINDGIFIKEEYEKASKKVLFIGKECNLAHDTDMIKEEVYTSGQNFWASYEVEKALKGEKVNNKFIKGLAMINNAILNENYSTPNKNPSTLVNAAMINLNKRGGYDYCIWETLEGYVKKYEDKIREQIDLINPDEIVCCGESVNELVTKYHLADNRIVRCAFHPSYYSTSDINKLHYLETGEKPNRTDENTLFKQNSENEIKGCIFDTNNRYGIKNEEYMMREAKACAWGDRRKCLGCFNPYDYVLFYSSIKRGIIAIGQVEKLGDDDKNDSEWWTVNPIVPKDFKRAVEETKVFPLSGIREIVAKKGKGLLLNNTIKYPYLDKEQVEEIVNILKSQYGENY